LSPTGILDARLGRADDVLDDAIAAFALKVIQQRGLVDDAELVAAQKAGVDDSLMVEIVANVSLNTLTNYNNRLADTEIDFPVVELELNEHSNQGA
jgi:alkylhydroperoxidase family enzyme